MEKLREIVEGVNSRGETIKLAVTRPGYKVRQEAQLEYNRKVAGLLRQGANGGERLLLKAELEEHLKKIGVWTAQDALRLAKLQMDLRTSELALRAGGMKLSEARNMALHMGDLRNDLMRLYGKRSQFDSLTIEATAENHKFNWLATRCIVDAETGRPYMMDIQEWEEKAEEPVVILASARLAHILYGLDPKVIDNLYENQWLRKYGYMNGEGRLTNREGRLVDRDMKLVNEDGRYVNEAGQFVDREGKPVAETGEPIIESQPFIDDETGQPLIEAAADTPAGSGANAEPEAPKAGKRKRRS